MSGERNLEKNRALALRASLAVELVVPLVLKLSMQCNTSAEMYANRACE